MRYLQSIITWIDSLESGRQFRNWAAILVKIFAVAILVGLSVAGTEIFPLDPRGTPLLPQVRFCL